MWKRRLIEKFAILTVGDRLIEFLAPKGHSRLCLVGPESTRRIGMWFVEKPNRMRILGAAQVMLGVGWLLSSIGIFDLVEDLRETDMIGLARVPRTLTHTDPTTPEE